MPCYAKATTAGPSNLGGPGSAPTSRTRKPVPNLLEVSNPKQPRTQVLGEVEIRAPRIPVYSNVTAAPFPAAPDQMRALLARQLVEPVQWEGCLGGLLKLQGAGGEGPVGRGRGGERRHPSGRWRCALVCIGGRAGGPCLPLLVAGTYSGCGGGGVRG